ncbi:MAG TPA: hypothetical protein VGW34_01870 [Allosphingosinicella sp.]|nr:hypothetical protein [Allosphingosinicella sp.]
MRSSRRVLTILMAAGGILGLSACYGYGYDRGYSGPRDQGYRDYDGDGRYDREEGYRDVDPRGDAPPPGDAYDRGYQEEPDYPEEPDYREEPGYERDDYPERDWRDGDRRYGEYGYVGRDFAEDRAHGGRGRYGGEGGDALDPWLAQTRDGQDIVRMGFDEDNDGRVEGDTAERANSWFRRYADTNRDLRLTDEEIRVALRQAVRDRPWPGPRYD